MQTYRNNSYRVTSGWELAGMSTSKQIQGFPMMQVFLVSKQQVKSFESFQVFSFTRHVEPPRPGSWHFAPDRDQLTQDQELLLNFSVHCTSILTRSCKYIIFSYFDASFRSLPGLKADQAARLRFAWLGTKDSLRCKQKG